MEKSRSYLIEAFEYVNAIVDISLADSFFEASAESQEINERNEMASQGAISSIKKAIQSLIEYIKSLIKKFSDFIKNKFMTKSEKDDYKKVKEAGYDETSESNTVKYYALKMQDGSGFTWQGMHQVGLSGFGVDEVVEMTINCIFTKKPEFSETLTVNGG